MIPRALIGLGLGLPLAVILAALSAWLWGGDWRNGLTPAFLLVFPLWALLTVIAMHSRSTPRLLAGYTGLGLAGYGLLWSLRLYA
jgi:hypothetical protein